MRDHGTRTRFVWGPDDHDDPGSGCHCPSCTKANRDYENHRTRMQLYGRWQPYTDAGPAREHLRLLSECGIGWKRVVRLTGISSSAVSKLLYGGPGDRPPSRRIRPSTEAAILAVLPSRDLLAGKALTDGTATRRRLQALVALGYPKAQLAARLGMQLTNLTSVMERSQVIVATERVVSALYDELWATPPPETTHRQKLSASRARNYAAARSWALPWQWDDDMIGDPDAVPAERRQDSDPPRGRELAVEGRELVRYGLSREQAARRLGVSLNTLNTAMARFGRRPGEGAA